MGLTTTRSPLAKRYQRVGSLAVTDQDGPQPPKVTLKDLLGQFWADIYGKEVQSASTYSYTWVADQVGHVCIGIVLSFGLAILARYSLPPHNEDVSLRDGNTGPPNINYWPWSKAQVVIIDDLGPLIAAQDQQANLDKFQQLLETKLANVAPVLAKCFTVWVIGDLRPKGQTTIMGETLNQFARAIARFCQSAAGRHSPEEKEFLVVELSEEIEPVQESTAGVEPVSRKAQVRQHTL